MSQHDTIFALASARGRAGVAVVRISGPQAATVLTLMTAHNLPRPRMATLAPLKGAAGDRVLDRALVLWFPGPNSFTGEDVAELHIHGGRAILTAVFDVLSAQPGLRPAEAGEFTRRAVEHGKMDLTGAEGLIDLIDAETEAQRRQALRQMDGALGNLYEGWRTQLIRAQALIEADIDFADEGDVADGVARGARAIMSTVQDEITRHLDDARRGERLRDGLHIAIVGAPNAGKSSLMNMLAQRDVAIVSDTAGTTRDVLEVHLDLAGYPVVLADTAGLRETSEEIEAEGIRRARARAGAADFKVAVFDASEKPDLATLELVDDQTLVVLNKQDLVTDPTDLVMGPAAHMVRVSTTAMTGVTELLAVLTEVAEDALGGPGAPALTRTRHRQALVAATESLDQALQAVDNNMELALVAESVRYAARAIGRITGRVDVEDLLDVVFRDFCIGK